MSGVMEALLRLRVYIHQSRNILKRLGKKTNVDIEPDSQTELADSTEALCGVIGAGVPGAGGHDAIFVLVINATPESSSTCVRRQVSEFWVSQSTAAFTVCPLQLCAEKGSFTGLMLEAHLGWN